ncbi:uncharacterized protein [Palaemon carinicauda]|uniref:uncharacterized protein isoform X2 n=1 Tax=Palaemon carinicauda TaxID=392227 RepID=UPI0035B5CF54
MKKNLESPLQRGLAVPSCVDLDKIVEVSPSSSREMRNMAEKMRRDKLNNYVAEIAGIVPLGSGASANKRIDKTSVLRLAANYIRMHKILNDDDDPSNKRTPDFGREITHTLAEAVGGFLLVVTSSGKVVYITETVDQFFGHTQVDLLGHSIYNVIHPDDHDIFQQQLVPKENCRRSFYCRMMEKALSRNDPGRYEIILVVGQLRPLPQIQPCMPSSSMSSPASSSHCETSASSDHDEDESSDNEGEMKPIKVVNRTGTHMLVGFVRVVKDRPITELTLVESTQDEYITRHGMDGKILYTDHRISFVTGLMPTEVVGTSAFTYMHQDDILWSIVAQKLMFTSTQGQGVVSYRLKCKDGVHITLRSRGFLEVNKQTGQVESFVCINTVLSVNEAMLEIKNQRRKLLPIITCHETDDHLGSISSNLPPELMMVLKQVMNPETMRKMIASVDVNSLTPAESYESAQVMPLDSSPSRRLLPENAENDPIKNQFHTKPKRLCNKVSARKSVGDTWVSPKDEDDAWHKVTKKRPNLDEFTTVVSKKFSFQPDSPCPDLLHPNYKTSSSQNYSPETSPQPCLSPTTSIVPENVKIHQSGICHQYSSNIDNCDNSSQNHSGESSVIPPNMSQQYLKMDAVSPDELWKPVTPSAFSPQSSGQGFLISEGDCKTINMPSPSRNNQRTALVIADSPSFDQSIGVAFSPGLRDLRINDCENPQTNQHHRSEDLSPDFTTLSGTEVPAIECNLIQTRCDTVCLPSGQNQGIESYNQSTSLGISYPRSYNQNKYPVSPPSRNSGHDEKFIHATPDTDVSACKVISSTAPSHCSYQFSASPLNDHSTILSPKLYAQYQPGSPGINYSVSQSQYPYTIPAQDQGYTVPPHTLSSTSSGYCTDFSPQLQKQQQGLQGITLPPNQESNLHAVPITTSYNVSMGESGTSGKLL